MLKILLLLLLFSLLSYPQDSVYIMQPIEVTAIRPVFELQSFEHFKKKEIQNLSPGLSLKENFSKAPGVFISDRNNPSLGDKISIRGIGSRSSFGVRGIKILVDDIPLTLPDGQSQTNNIDLLSTGNVEILKGPASSNYGNAAGGVINFQTEFPTNKIINISPQIIFGSYNLQSYSLKLSGRYNSNSYLISFNNINYDGFRKHSEMKSYHLNTVYRNYFSHNLNLTAVINYFDSPYLLNPGSLSREMLEQNRNTTREFNIQQGTGEKANQFQSGLTLDYANDNFNIKATIYFLTRDLINPIPVRIIILNRKAGGFRSIANKNFNYENLSFDLSAGMDIEFQNDLRKEYENNGLTDLNNADDIFENLNYGNKLIDQKENVSGIGPFISAKFILNEILGLLAGIRYDQYTFKVNDSYSGNSGSRLMKQFSPSAGMFYKPTDKSKIFINYSTSFQTPTTSEFSNRPDAEGGFNSNLNPERIYQFELGSEFLDLFSLKREITVRLSLYYLNFSNLIIPYQVQNSEEVFFRNAGKAENKGAEISVELYPLQNIQTTLSYSLMDFIFNDYLVEYDNNMYQLNGYKVPGVPQQSFFFETKYLNETGFEGSVKLNWVDEYFTNDFNGTPPGSSISSNNYLNNSYLKTDLKVIYNLSLDYFNTDIFIGVNNLFDIKYNGSVVPNAFGERYFEPAPGRTWYAGFRIDY